MEAVHPALFPCRPWELKVPPEKKVAVRRQPAGKLKVTPGESSHRSDFSCVAFASSSL